MTCAVPQKERTSASVVSPTSSAPPWRTRNPESSANWDPLPGCPCAGEEHRDGLEKSFRNAGGQASTCSPLKPTIRSLVKDVAMLPMDTALWMTMMQSQVTSPKMVRIKGLESEIRNGTCSRSGASLPYGTSSGWRVILPWRLGIVRNSGLGHEPAANAGLSLGWWGGREGETTEKRKMNLGFQVLV